MAGRPSAWAVAADLLDPPPPPAYKTSPLAFGIHTGRGRYRTARHLEVMETEALQAIDDHSRLVFEVSIRHGKTQLLERLMAWFIGTNPDKRVILGGHHADFAARRGRAVRDLLMEWGPTLFGVHVSRRSESASRWDMAGHAGGMITVGVGGAPIGEGADLMVIDDPLKSYENAMSPLQRGRVNEWIVGTMFSRLEPGAAVLMALARWHDDDPAGFLKREDPDNWRSVRMPALCDDPATDPLGRALDEPLWPERFDKAELYKRRAEMSLALGSVVWDAQAQQRTYPVGGGAFPEDKWGFLRADEVPADTRWCRGYDLAATEGGGDWTVGARMGRMPDGRFVVGDVLRGQWTGHVWRTKMRDTAAHDPDGTTIQLPQDPGQAGKDQAVQLVSFLAGFNAKANPVTGSKEIRAAGYAAQVQAGNVLLVEAPWNGAFVAEHTLFPRGTHDDQVDAAATAFNVLAPTGEPSVRWLTS